MHIVRSSLKFVSYKDRKAVAAGLKKIYTAATEETALAGLSEFCSAWDEKYPAIGMSWKNRWTEICPFLEYPPQIRKAIYTTNAIESLNYSLRKVTKNRLAFPTADAAMKLVFMALGNISQKWTMPIANWGQAINHLAIKFDGRVPV